MNSLIDAKKLGIVHSLRAGHESGGVLDSHQQLDYTEGDYCGGMMWIFTKNFLKRLKEVMAPR